MADKSVAAPAIAPTKHRKPRTINKEREKANKLIREALVVREDEVRRCEGSVKLRADMERAAGPDNPYFLNDDGSIQTRPCNKPPIKGGMVCMSHGGSASQVRAKADRRLLAMVEPSLIRLDALVQQNEHLPTALGALRTVLERAGSRSIGPLVKETGEKDTRPIINIGIKVGGIDKPVVTVAMLPSTAAADEATEGEMIDGDGDPDID
jgi:hypothetical protein